jgi:hypothetical protein
MLMMSSCVPEAECTTNAGLPGIPLSCDCWLNETTDDFFLTDIGFVGGLGRRVASVWQLPLANLCLFGAAKQGSEAVDYDVWR